MTFAILTIVAFLFGLAQIQAKQVLTVNCTHQLEGNETVFEVSILLNKTEIYKYKNGTGTNN